MGPMKPSGPSHGPFQVNRLPKHHGLPDWPLKFMGPGIIVPPPPSPLSAALVIGRRQNSSLCTVINFWFTGVREAK